jgi:hypothetical protein
MLLVCSCLVGPRLGNRSANLGKCLIEARCPGQLVTQQSHSVILLECPLWVGILLRTAGAGAALVGGFPGRRRTAILSSAFSQHANEENSN